jgi:redox-sensitive bicupin YhaK (pirin superfamily)
MTNFAVLAAQSKDLGGGFFVRRLLPSAGRQAVGPFLFFDHFGPTAMQPGEHHDVRPHPHIGLATVTTLFEGAMLHRDSLGAV